MNKAVLLMTEKDIARFWSKVDVRGPDECWPWLAHCEVKGYGRFNCGGGGSGVIVKASQVACFLTHGWPDPPTLHALHDCDNPICCNGTHLFYGTNADNVRDAASKGRLRLQQHPEFARGERHNMVKLTESQVRDIRQSDLRVRDLVKIYDVTASTISAIRVRRLWSHVA